MTLCAFIVIVAIATLGSAYYIYNQDKSAKTGVTINSHRISNSNNSANPNSSTNTNTAANPNANVITNTNSWLAYANTKFNYTIKHPSDWSDDNTADANPAMFVDPVAIAQTIESELTQGTKIEVVVDQNIDVSVTEFAAGQDKEGDILSQSDMTVAGTPGLWRAVSGPLSYYNVTYVKNDTNIYRIIQYIPRVEDRGRYTAIYDQMLLNFALTK
jgi:hypothetical protein